MPKTGIEPGSIKKSINLKAAAQTVLLRLVIICLDPLTGIDQPANKVCSTPLLIKNTQQLWE